MEPESTDSRIDGQPEKQDKESKYKSYLLAGWALSALILAMAGAFLYYGIINPRREYRQRRSKMAQMCGLSLETLDEYKTKGIEDLFWITFNESDMNLAALDSILNDPEFLDRAKEQLGEDADANDLRSKIAHLMVGINAEGYKPDWDYYLKLRSNDMGGFFTMIAANNYGPISIDDMLRIPHQPTEEIFLALGRHNVPVENSLPLLLHGVKSTDIIELHNSHVPTKYALPFIQAEFWPYDIIFFWRRRIPVEYALPLKDELSPKQIADKYDIEKAATNWGVSLEELLEIPYQTTKEAFKLLDEEGIPVKYGVPRLQKGQKPHDIVDEYSIEMTGVSAEVRREYRAIFNQYGIKLEDPQIRMLATKGMTLDYFGKVAIDGKSSIIRTFNLTQQDKLNGEIFERWVPEFSVDDILCALENGYDREFALRALVVYGSLVEFHKHRQQYQFMQEFFKEKLQQLQPMLDSAPR